MSSLHDQSFGIVKGGANGRAVTQAPVRRPLRGIEIKDDRYATIRVIKADGTNIPLLDSGSTNYSTSVSGFPTPADKSHAASSVIYSNFILQNVDDVRQEKSQLMETFGDTYVFFFGERPRILQVSGLLFNTLDFNWRSEFWKNYETVLRGTRLVEQNARLYLQWDDIIVEGYILGAQAQDVADLPYHIPFNFTLFVTNHTYLSAIGDDMYPVRFGAKVTPLQDALGGVLKSDSFTNTLLSGSSTMAGLAQLQSLAIGTGTVLAANALKAQLHQSGKPLSTQKEVLASAIGLGLQTAGMTFLNVVGEYFKNKRIAIPQRTTPLRTKISDNFDEYINGPAGPPPPYDQSALAYAKARQERLQTVDQVTKSVQFGMLFAGTDPISVTQAGIYNPFDRAHSVSAVPTTPNTDLEKFDPTTSTGHEDASSLGF
jgi:hypothetical protein